MQLMVDDYELRLVVDAMNYDLIDHYQIHPIDNHSIHHHYYHLLNHYDDVAEVVVVEEVEVAVILRFDDPIV
jgi:hypothetical protein